MLYRSIYALVLLLFVWFLITMQTSQASRLVIEVSFVVAACEVALLLWWRGQKNKEVSYVRAASWSAALAFLAASAANSDPKMVTPGSAVTWGAFFGIMVLSIVRAFSGRLFGTPRSAVGNTPVRVISAVGFLVGAATSFVLGREIPFYVYPSLAGGLAGAVILRLAWRRERRAVWGDAVIACFAGALPAAVIGMCLVVLKGERHYTAMTGLYDAIRFGTGMGLVAATLTTWGMVALTGIGSLSKGLVPPTNEPTAISVSGAGL